MVLPDNVGTPIRPKIYPNFRIHLGKAFWGNLPILQVGPPKFLGAKMFILGIFRKSLFDRTTVKISGIFIAGFFQTKKLCP